MRVAVFSDVQGNYPAMEAALDHIQDWSPDLVVMAGDLVNRGPSSRTCLDRFLTLYRSRGWLPVRGNHEDWVIRCGRERPLNRVDAEMRRFADFSFAQVADIAETMAAWPDHLCFHGSTRNSWVQVSHGTMAGNRNGITAAVPDEALHDKLPEDIDLFVTAHTHRPLTRHYKGTDILNVGSVGSPFDGDIRASYGQLEFHNGRWRTRIQRLDYDRARTRRDFLESGFVHEGGPLARIIFLEWQTARLLMPSWHRRYGDAVRAGEIGLDKAVDDFMAEFE